MRYTLASKPLALVSLAILAGCGSDVIGSSTIPVVPSALVLTPNAIAVDTAGTLQFEAKGRFPDGSERVVPVTYSATGGEISAGGLYRATVAPGEYRVIAACACGVSDTALVVVTAGLRALQLLLTPASATIDTAATQQFTPAVVWSDQADHPAQLSYSATGGTISAVGLFRAGRVPGDYQVVATCSCGVADTAEVRVTGSGASIGTAALSVAITGLPLGLQAAVSVSGPGGFSRTVTASGVLDSLAAGDYEVRASGLTLGLTSYSPNAVLQTVRVTSGVVASSQVTYSVLTSNGLPSHPRVWMNAERIARVRAQAASGTSRWTRVRAAADAQLARGSAYAIEDLDKLPDLCLAYLGAQDVRYAQRAGVVLSSYAVESNTLTGDSGYGMRFILPLITMGLDWCYDGLTVPQRQQAATWLMNRADWIWPQTNPSRFSGFAVNDVGNNYWWGFMMSGPAALAASGDDTGAGALSGPDRPRFHRELALQKWSAQAVPFLSGEGAGGAWGEGTNYESTWRLGAFTDAFTTAGIPVATSFLADAARWKIHSTMPGGRFKVPFGDQPRVSDASLFTYDRMQMLYALPSADASLLSQSYRWLNDVDQVATSEFNATATLADELLRYDPAQPQGSYAGLTRDFYAPGPGFFLYRQSWADPNTTVMAFESGPVSVGGHGARNANGLMIWKGQFWISSTANIYSQSGIETGTQNYNNLTVGGLGQVLYGGNDGVMSTPQVSDQLVVVQGQAKNSYGYPAGVSYGRTVVSDYRRTVAYLPQADVFVIVDRAGVFDASKQKTWYWQSKGTPVISGNTFQLESGARDFRCFGSVLAPSDVSLGTETRALASGGGTSSYAVSVSMVGRLNDVVVTVLQCTGAQSAPFTATATVGSADATVTVAGRRVIVPLADGQATRIE